MYPYHVGRVASYGASFKRRVRELFPAHSIPAAYAKAVAAAENRVTLAGYRASGSGVVELKRAINSPTLAASPPAST